MTIERLNELREIVLGDKEYLTNLNTYHEPENELLKLIDAEIARQSVTDQQVKDAIVWLEESVAMYQTSIDLYPEEEYDNNWHKAVSKGKTAITALEQMRTEPCDKCTNRECALSGGGDHCPVNSCSECKHYILDFNYCPNCGRKLVTE